MCKSRSWISNDPKTQESNEVSKNPERDELDKFYEQVEDLKSNLSEVTKSFIGFTHESMKDMNDKARDYSLNWLFGSDDSAKQARKMDHSWTSIFDRIDDELSVDSIGIHPFSNLDFRKVRDFYDSGFFRKGRTPFGYFSHRSSPSTRAYNDCMKNDGASVWDSEGHWRCLFPNKAIPEKFLTFKNENYPDAVLTKEDLESGNTKNGIIDLGSKGKYFQKFEDYLNWKNIMFENIKRERELKREKFLNDKYTTTTTTPSKDKNDVMSKSVQIFYSTNPDTKEVEYKKIDTEVYNDGNTVTNTINKIKPEGSNEWIDVSNEYNPSFGDEDSKNSGWFWNSKDN